MQQNPNDTTERAQSSQSARPSGGTARPGSDRLTGDLGETAGDRSATAFSSTSGTLGRESLGGESKPETTAESARDTAQQAAEQVKDKAAQVKEKVTTLKATLADKLDAGAERLRQRAAHTPVTEAGAQAETTVRKTGTKVAEGMENTADWLRNTDMASLKSGIEAQVRTKPGRTLLIALGAGYVLGRLIRGRREG